MQAALDRAGIAFWGPRQMRRGLLDGLDPKTRLMTGRKSTPARAEGRVRLRIEAERAAGRTALLVSEENLIGTLRGCIRDHALYVAAGERMSRHAQAFGGRFARVALAIRAQDRFWASALAFGVARGHAVPGAARLARIAAGERSWRDVIVDIACALPEAEIRVIPFESFYANPVTLCRQALGIGTGLRGSHEWLNRAPDLPKLRQVLRDRGDSPDDLPGGEGAWSPFTADQVTAMRERYDDDLFWLVQGADGLATLTEEAMPRARGQARHAHHAGGHEDDEEGRLDEAG